MLNRFVECFMKKTNILGAVILSCSIFITGCKDFTPPFEEVRMVKDGQHRIYAVYVATDDRQQMEKYAKKKKWTEGTATTVYFFSNRLEVPAKAFLAPLKNLKQEYQEHLVLTYIRHPEGSDEFLE